MKDSWHKMRSSGIDVANGYSVSFNLRKKKNASTNKPKKNMNVDSANIVYAGEEEEFFYSKTNEAVPEGEAIGFDVDQGDEVELVLFSDIEWRPLLN